MNRLFLIAMGVALIIGFSVSNTAWVYAYSPDNTEASAFCKEECAGTAFNEGEKCRISGNYFESIGDCVSYFNVDQNMGNHVGDWVDDCKWYNSCNTSTDILCKILHRLGPEFKNLGQCLQFAEELF